MTDKALFSDLARKFKQGDDEAFAQMHVLEYDKLCSYAYKFSRDWTEAEDIAEDSFVKLYSMRDRLDDRKSVKALLYTITRNAALDSLREARARDTAFKEILYFSREEEIPYLEMINEEVLKVLHAQINELPPQCAQVFRLLYFEGKTPREIAKKLKISVKTVHSHKFTARKLLSAGILKIDLPLYLLVLIDMLCKN